MKNRVHLDLRSTDDPSEAEQARLLALGATEVGRGAQGPHAWVVLTRPGRQRALPAGARAGPVRRPAARGPPAARPTSGPGRRPRRRRSRSSVSAARATRTSSPSSHSAIRAGAESSAEVVRSTCAVSWACTACRSSRSAARAMVCHLSSRGSATIRCSSAGRPSRSPSAKWTRATSAGSRPSRCGGLDDAEQHVRRRQHRHPAGQVLGHAARSSSRRGAPGTPSSSRPVIRSGSCAIVACTGRRRTGRPWPGCRAAAAGW